MSTLTLYTFRMAYILALDQGTTSSRALVFDHRGNVHAVAQAEFAQHFPRPGWVEHDATEIWATQSGVLHGALAKAGIGARDIAAIGITNQRETTLLWERATGRPVANAIVWQDRRTAPMCDELRARGLAPLFARKTGLVLDAYFSGTKLKWLLDNVDGARARAARGELAFGTMDSWLVWQLSGGNTHITDATNASRTLLYDLERGDWDDELLAILDVPREVLPRVVASSGIVATAAIGGVDVPIAGIAGDQQAALFGQACHSPGLGKNTYGTGCFLLLNTGTKRVASSNNLVTTVAWQLPGGREFALEGSVFIAGAVVQWLRDGLKIIRQAADVEALAASVDDNGGVYFVPAFAGLGAPHWDAYARGSMFGLTRGASGGHLARAALESIAFQSADVLAAMERDAGMTLAELRVDGGATANDLLMQFQADILGVPVVRPKVLETTALGAGYLAGLAVGYWKDASDVAANWQIDRRFEPAMSRDRALDLQGAMDAGRRASETMGNVKSTRGRVEDRTTRHPEAQPRRALSCAPRAIVVACAVAALASTHAAFAQTQPTKSDLRRGEYLVKYGGCNDCHSPKNMTAQGPVPDPARLLSGHRADTPLPTLPAGVVGPKQWGAVTNNDLTAWVGPGERASREPDAGRGNRPWQMDGRPVHQDDAHRQASRRGQTGAAADALVWRRRAERRRPESGFAYLQSLKPIRNAVPAPLPPQ